MNEPQPHSPLSPAQERSLVSPPETQVAKYSAKWETRRGKSNAASSHDRTERKGNSRRPVSSKPKATFVCFAGFPPCAVFVCVLSFGSRWSGRGGSGAETISCLGCWVVILRCLRAMPVPKLLACLARGMGREMWEGEANRGVEKGRTYQSFQ